MIAKQIINGPVPAIAPATPIHDVLDLMDDSKLSHLPLIREGVLLGILSEKECLACNDPDLPVEASHLVLINDRVGENDHLFDVLKSMAEAKLSMIPVVNEKNQYLGSVTLNSLLPGLSKITAAENPGGIIVIELNIHDYSLSEISQIVEANDARILSLFVANVPDSTRMEVTIKINRIEIGPILQTFYRYNYTVHASWSKEDAYFDGLHDRFDALMNYLNI